MLEISVSICYILDVGHFSEISVYMLLPNGCRKVLGNFCVHDPLDVG